MALQVPKYHELMNPLLEALKCLGGSGSNEEVFAKVAEIAKLSEEVLSIPHKQGQDSRSEVEYRLAWARTYLKKFGAITSSEKGVWSLTPEFKDGARVDPAEVVQRVRDIDRKNRESTGPAAERRNSAEFEDEEDIDGWREQLFQTLTKEISAAAFEKLVQRVLRESGFIQVNVTGRSGDGGIDGTGVMKLGGLLSFHVVFQCKRYTGSVSPSEIRDFRGAMVGRADKGLFLTTGTFTREAMREATRAGAPPIELVDGAQLADMLKDLKLGIQTEAVERVTVNTDWFKSF